MPARGLLIGAVVLALLGGAAYWSERAKKAEEGKPAEGAAPKLVTVPEDQVRKIEIKKKDSEPVVLVKNPGNKWEMTSPKPLGVDQDSANTVASAFNGLTWDRLVEEKTGNLAEYGLAAPSAHVTVTAKDGKSHTLLIGDEAPTGGSFFAKLSNDPRVFTIASYTKSNLDKTPQDLRDKRLLTFDSDKVTRVELQAKKQAMEFGKNNQNEWQIVKPQPLRADSFQIEEIIRKLKDARMDTSVTEEDAKKAASAFAGAAQVAVAKVTDAAGPQTLEVRKVTKDKETTYYAKSSVVEGVHKAANDLGEGLDKGLDDIRTKKLFDFGFSDPTRVEIRDGERTFAFQKSGEKWMAGTQQMDSTGVQALIDKLRDLSSIKFVDKGFTTAALNLTVVSNEGKRTEMVAISKSGNSYFAKRENEPAVYELDGKNVEELQKAAADVKPAQPAKQDDKNKKK